VINTNSVFTQTIGGSVKSESCDDLLTMTGHVRKYEPVRSPPVRLGLNFKGAQLTERMDEMQAK